MPTMHGGTFSNTAAKPKLLIFLRKTIFPSTPNPTRRKTSLPMSTPITIGNAVSDSVFAFMAASPADRRLLSGVSSVGKAAGPSR
jgi:hypothetical protein